MKKLSFVFWLVPTVLCPVLLARGVWSLLQPWGVQYQKIVALLVFFILWIVSLYFLLQNRLNLTSIEREKGKWFFVGLACAAFVLGGILVSIIEPANWKMNTLSTGFFGLGLAVAIIKYKSV